ncbi:Multifunctional conjugation protein TraI [Legionella massiliensis]|uniref:Multifunctional conjugation protein TraI n=1 Tax=Legionella massiliensis TaxID=1034943 RepID=A0A078L2N4_9GAMM|nr:conjugative transfer relaxase/helicase TraI [Legionella massiliensis]CDZ79416.1 Multifunctional conjugation protein TraI [Legionella massiliensis]CEE15154.1 Multifunctional conjugation protein TraI [Legionella massiliensis]
MLSIQPLKSASGSANYYLNVVNYYANDSKSIRWLGEGAKALSLHNQLVEKEQMLALLEGRLPDGSQLGRIDKDGIHHRPGFDMTVSAPKSFSILLESGADSRLAEVLDKAVEWFVAEMEQEFAEARLMVNGEIEYVATKNFVVASFRQPNSRANDPQSHVHLVVMNMTQCKDGKWRSLASDMSAERGVVEQIMKNHIYGGLKFRNKLANLTKELGYTLETTGEGLWEIKGVPKDLLTHFSKRREDIELYMEEHGLHGARAASKATQRTKMDKEIVDFAAWKADILTACKSLGFDALQFVAQTKEPKPLFARIKETVVHQFFDKEKFQTIKGKEAVTLAIESVSQLHAVFSPQKIKEHALKHLIASDWVVDERYINQAIDYHIREQTLYCARHPVTQKPLLTTPWQLQLESDTLSRMEQGKSAIHPIASAFQVTSFITNKEAELHLSLSPSQKKAMHGFLTSNDRFMAIQGYAGTGKTTMLKLTRELAESKGYQLRGITAGSSAACELQLKGGLNASTFARELIRLKKNGDDLTRTVFVVDEASMLSNPQGHKIMQLIDEAKSQLKIIGDRAQLPSPSSGRWFSLIQDYGINTVEMTDNLRQEEGLLKESAIHASRGEIYDAVEKLTVVKEYESYQERIEDLANTWLNLSPLERKETLCFAPTHKNRKDITEIIRQRLKEEGVLTGNTHYQSILISRPITSIELRNSIYYAPGEVLRFNMSIPRYNIKTGDYLTVQDISSKNKKANTLSLSRDNGRSITLPLSALPKFNPSEKDLERPIEVYREGRIEIQVGDTIQWKRNDQSKAIHNSDIATVKAISNDEVLIINKNNQELVLKHRDSVLKHLDHGYVLTTYGAQGKDSKRGIGLIESLNRFAATIENFYVEVTRAVEEMIVVTDDKNHLVKAITTRDSEKGSSIEAIDSTTLKRHAMQHNPTELALQQVIAKKQVREAQWMQMEQNIASYNEAHLGTNQLAAPILAYKIVTDKVCYRLAQARLSHGYKSYRRDALALQTAKLSTSLTDAEKKHFNHVKQYVCLAERVVKETQRLVQLRDVKNDKGMNQKALQKDYNALNQLAFTIAADLKSHKEWLTHFSIGEANRLGLPQHHIETENQKAYTRLERLCKRASQFQMRQKVLDYIKSDAEQKPFLAQQIKRDSKLAHRFIMDWAKTEGQTADTLWKAIHTDARTQSDRLFRQGLSSEGKKAFDQIKALKTLQLELRTSWQTALNVAGKTDGQKIAPQTQQLLILKNKVSAELIKAPALMDVASYFKLDLDRLKKHSTQHHYRETVYQFQSSTSHFKKRLQCARLIKENVQGHYPYLVEANMDKRLLAKYLRVVERAERLEELKDGEKDDYKKVLHYKKANHEAKRHWKAHYALSPLERKANAQLTQSASQQSGIRDALAYSLRDSPWLDTHLNLERIDRDKINQQAKNHETKRQQIQAINLLASKLIQQYATLENQNNAAHIKAWKTNWTQLTEELNRIQGNSSFKEALKGHESLLKQVKQFDATYKERYQLEEPTRPPTQQLKNPTLRKIKSETPFLDAQTINEALMVNPITSYTAIFGEPNSLSAKEMRYSGGLLVALKGRKQGLWYDFGEGQGGTPIDAIMSSRGMNFKDALQVAADLAGIAPNKSTITFITPRFNALIQKDEQQLIENKQASAKSIWEGSLPIQGTLAETYLKTHRGIEQCTQLNVRFWPKGAKWINCDEEGILVEKTNQIPALIVPAQDANHQLTGVQRIYLDAQTGGKNRFMDNPKLSKGVIEGSAAILQKGMKGATVYLCEGPETAASIAEAFPTATVIASLGISNIKNMAPLIQQAQGKEVIIAGDHDGDQSKTSLIAQEAHEALKRDGMDVKIVFPEPIKTLTKTDWNDVLIHKGKESIKVQLSKIITVNKTSLLDINSTITADKSPALREPVKSDLPIKNETLFKNEIDRSLQRIKEMEIEL